MFENDRRPLPWQQNQSTLEYWQGQGLSKRSANGLIYAGYATIDDLRETTDQDLAVIANVGTEARIVIYRLLGRQPPGKLRSAAEIRDELARAWQSRLGVDRFNRLLDEIAEMADGDLDKANWPAGRALWSLARLRRDQLRRE
jgi:hypothetical protein